MCFIRRWAGLLPPNLPKANLVNTLSRVGCYIRFSVPPVSPQHLVLLCTPTIWIQVYKLQDFENFTVSDVHYFGETTRMRSTPRRTVPLTFTIRLAVYVAFIIFMEVWKCCKKGVNRIEIPIMPIASNRTEVQFLAQQIIAEMSFSFHPNDNGSKRAPNAFKGRFDNERLAAKLTISSPAKETTISSISFGERIDGCSNRDSFQLVTDENGLSWWYDTSKRNPDSSSR